jgi:Tol biopolymer transport system component
MLRLITRMAGLIVICLITAIALLPALLGNTGSILLLSTTWSSSLVVGLTRTAPPGLYLLDMASGLHLPLGNIIYVGDVPLVSPDGSQYAILVNNDVYLLKNETLTLTRLTNTPGASKLHLIWSPAGDHLAVTLADPPGAPGDIAIIDMVSSAADYLTETPQQNEILLDWSPDGESLLFARPAETSSSLYLVSPDGGNLRRLNDGYWGQFSPDGDLIASMTGVGLFVTTPSGLIQHVFPFTYVFYWSNSGRYLTVINEDAIVIADMTDGTRRILIESRQTFGAVSWSPDDSQLTFVLGDDIYIATASGSPRRLTQTPEVEYAPVWSPDGTQIAFLRQGSSSAVCTPNLLSGKQICHPIAAGRFFNAAWLR